MGQLVSILIPAYNAQEFLAQAIRSALAQTWREKEIIVLDDGSKDRTLEIARGFESQGVKVFAQANQGAAAARNRLFELSKGDYIQWLDADDLLSPDKVERQMREALRDNDPAKLYSCAWGRFLYRPWRARFTPSPLWQDLSSAEWLILKLENNTYLQTACWLVSRQLTEAAGPWNTQLLGDDDGEYFARVLLGSSGVRFISGPRVYYRAAGAGSLSHVGRSDRKMEAQWRSMELTIGHLRQLDDGPKARAALVRYLQDWLVVFHPWRPDLVEKAEDLARNFGGSVERPRPRWKYAWIGVLAGPKALLYAQAVLPSVRHSATLRWDRILYRTATKRRAVASRGQAQ